MNGRRPGRAVSFVVQISTANDTCSRLGRPARGRRFASRRRAVSVDRSTGRAGDGQANCRDTAGAVAAKAALAMRARRAAKVRRDQDARFRTGQIGYSAVSVNGSWRLTFRFEGADAVLVNDQDHH
ncbi:hypothetical protein LGN24_26815 [Burkholderia seminalis]|uniref:hypothetical protein n=1 Tax=Burkholderia seminalis TaxID=488731 RepID=UPI0009F233A0|nr:hypothetical protein [Burkholderia seminalis]MCA8305102.1 hypothetical protein [Burkholderia seminalis]MCA8428097.1 hypothetical protein [Burkholderia seminalis]